MKLIGLLVAVALVGCAADFDEDIDETSGEITGGRIVVSSFGQPGASISKWGYDIKQDGRAKALKPALAKEIFGDIGMNMLRIPVRATVGHPSRGKVDESAYADDIEAIKNVKAVNGGVDVFASVKLLGKQSFPGWVKTGGEVVADDYAVLIEDYLGFMKDNGVTVDWLGVDNESKFNEGNITPTKYNRIVSDVRQWCKAHDVKVPGFIAAEDYGPTEDTPWLKNLWQTGAQFDNVDHVGVHIYSKHRDAGYRAAMDTLANNIHGKGLWDSELHWNDLDDDGVKFDEISLGMLTVFDHFDQGFHGLSWWAFQPRSNGSKAAYVMSELVSTTVGSKLLATDDGDGKTPADKKINTRAFKHDDKHVTVWVANFGAGQKGQWTEIKNQKIASATYVQWSAQSAAKGEDGQASVPAKNPAVFSMTYPANTITRISVTLK